MRLEHARCDARYEAAGDKSLTEHAKIISQAGNDITLAGCECAQSRSRDFFRSLAIRSRGGHVRLSGDIRKF